MTASGGLYPSIGRYFRTVSDLADAGCMSRRRLYDILQGNKRFTRAEQKAIAANIAQKIMDQPVIDYDELTRAHEAWKGRFDEIYKRKTV